MPCDFPEHHGSSGGGPPWPLIFAVIAVALGSTVVGAIIHILSIALTFIGIAALAVGGGRLLWWLGHRQQRQIPVQYQPQMSQPRGGQGCRRTSRRRSGSSLAPSRRCITTTASRCRSWRSSSSAGRAAAASNRLPAGMVPARAIRKEPEMARMSAEDEAVARILADRSPQAVELAGQFIQARQDASDPAVMTRWFAAAMDIATAPKPVCEGRP
jgi:hypothetical protein